MVNARLMGGADWRTMSWQEYQTLLPHWNARHAADAGQVAPDLDAARRAMAGVLH